MMTTETRKDFYKVLGVAETATADEIKKAYRKLAKRYHPDATGGDKSKETKFKEISEAYEVVGDEKKRAAYDAARKNPFAGGFPGGASPFGAGFPGGGTRVNIDLDDLLGRRARGGGAETGGDSFGDIFSDLFGFGGAAGRATGHDITLHAELDLSTAALGGEHAVTTPQGRITVKIPPGIDDGQTIRVAGKGEPGTKGRPAGDLLIEVKVKPHPLFRRKGTDLEVDVPIAIDQAVLGAKVDVPTLEGKAQVTVPAGSSSGLKLRLRGKGVPARAAGATSPQQRGDLYAVLQIVVPKDIPPRARELITEFARLTKTKS
ncbi:MAG TPA: DnaJ C-terminal domain-containing protein [Polyangia bacterium]|nr:DnaJ C-terminal domain-containing protein [Polyangia bacterium]